MLRLTSRMGARILRMMSSATTTGADRTVPDALSLAQAAKALAMSPRTLRIQARRGTLRALKVGRQWLVTPSEVVVVSTFHIDLEAGSGHMHITLPYAMIEPIRELLDAGVQSDVTEKDER